MPNRIISLVPSLTEYIAEIAPNSLAGRTRFCIHPQPFISRIPIVGGTKQVNFEKIKTLKPDLIVLNKEENRKDDAKHLADLADIVVTEIDDIQSVLDELFALAKKINAETQALPLLNGIIEEFGNRIHLPKRKTAYLIWKDPWMCVGSRTYINDVMSNWGFENCFSNNTRYPEITLTDLQEAKPELVLLSSEPFPFKSKHIRELHSNLPKSKIQLVDGEIFSWYGSRMLPSFKKLNQLPDWDQLLPYSN